MKNTNTVVSMPQHEFDQIGRLLETTKSQSEMIAKLTRECNEINERLRRNILADQRRAEVFRISTRS